MAVNRKRAGEAKTFFGNFADDGAGAARGARIACIAALSRVHVLGVQSGLVNGKVADNERPRGRDGDAKLGCLTDGLALCCVRTI